MKKRSRAMAKRASEATAYRMSRPKPGEHMSTGMKPRPSNPHAPNTLWNPKVQFVTMEPSKVKPYKRGE